MLDDLPSATRGAVCLCSDLFPVFVELGDLEFPLTVTVSGRLFRDLRFIYIWYFLRAVEDCQSAHIPGTESFLSHIPLDRVWDLTEAWYY